MLLDPRGEYRKIADFLSFGDLVSDAEIAKIAGETTAAALAKKEAEGKLLGKTKVSRYNAKKSIKNLTVCSLLMAGLEFVAVYKFTPL